VVIKVNNNRHKNRFYSREYFPWMYPAPFEPKPNIPIPPPVNKPKVPLSHHTFLRAYSRLVKDGATLARTVELDCSCGFNQIGSESLMREMRFVHLKKSGSMDPKVRFREMW